MIPKDVIDTIIETAQIDEVVGDFVSLKKKGANLWGCCPFHNEKTPSFTVSPAKGIYKCFGCGVGGNSVNFVMEHEHISYPEALKFLANKYQIEVPEQERTEEQIIEENKRESLYNVSQFAENVFKDNLWESDEGKAIGLSYFHQRGFTDETIEKFKLGYSDDKWESLTQAAKDKGYSELAMVETGLTIEKEKRKYDRFRSRVMFPIHNLSGRPIAFGARTLQKDTKKTPKYLNSPESEIYHKSQVLYGIYQAKRAIISDDVCYLVEGYTDVISLHQAGIENVVASSGTSLTTEQIKLIKRFTSNITILYDGDPAGIKASFRGIDMILSEGMNVKVLLFPEGEDPDSFARANSKPELENYLEENTEDFIQFKSHVLLKDAGDDPLKKAQLIKDIVRSIALIPDGVIRSMYVKSCATLLQVEEKIVLNELNVIRNKKLKKSSQPSGDIPKAPEQATSKPEVEKPKIDKRGSLIHWENEIVRLMIKFGGEEVYIADTREGDPINVLVADWIIHELNKDELELYQPYARKVVSEIQEGLNNDELPSEKHFYNHSDKEVAKKVIDLLASPYSLSENWLKRHEINVSTETTNLKQAIKIAVYSYKIKQIDTLLMTKQEELKGDLSVDEQMSILVEIQSYKQVKNALAKELGIVINW